jgi:hypothetical protein
MILLLFRFFLFAEMLAKSSHGEQGADAKEKPGHAIRAEDPVGDSRKRTSDQQRDDNQNEQTRQELAHTFTSTVERVHYQVEAYQ